MIQSSEPTPAVVDLAQSISETQSISLCNYCFFRMCSQLDSSHPMEQAFRIGMEWLAEECKPAMTVQTGACAWKKMLDILSQMTDNVRSRGMLSWHELGCSCMFSTSSHDIRSLLFKQLLPRAPPHHQSWQLTLTGPVAPLQQPS